LNFEEMLFLHLCVLHSRSQEKLFMAGSEVVVW
jgi:hypothetical protein